MSHSRLRLLGGLLSLGLGILVMALKFYAYRLTGSTAILSDALESIVNVAAAAFALWAIRAAEAPPDDNHPYGHGKLEFVTAVFEGGLISFAALTIGYEAITALLRGPVTPSLGKGVWVIALAGVLNGLLGLVLVWLGRKARSIALEADGKHVFTDFLTTIGILLALGLVALTGYAWIDPLIALVMAFALLFTGVPLVRQAVEGLIDAADPILLAKLLAIFERHREPGLIRMHYVRAMRNGRRIHVDGHLVVPEFWTVEETHEHVETFERRVSADLGECEIEFHNDPCRRMHCQACEYEPCPIRRVSFQGRPPLTLAELTSPVDITDRS